MQCPGCGRHADARFCPDCGTPLQKAGCRACGAALRPGARYCTQCGTATGAATARASNRAWYLAAGVLLVLIAAILVPMAVDEEDATASVPPAAGEAGPTPPPLSANMRENADRLFNRIMAAREQGDPAAAARFYPMAIQAYEAAEPLDADGLYHLSLLQTASGNPAGGVAAAQRILDMAPNHLLALGAAGEASLEAGDTAAARAFYDRFLENYESERTNEYPEYLDHARILTAYEQQARTIAGH